MTGRARGAVCGFLDDMIKDENEAIASYGGSLFVHPKVLSQIKKEEEGHKKQLLELKETFGCPASSYTGRQHVNFAPGISTDNVYGMRVSGGELCSDEELTEDCTEFGPCWEDDHTGKFQCEVEKGQPLTEEELGFIAEKALEEL